MNYHAINLSEKLTNLFKIQGDFVWHDHKDTDEVFIVIDG
jgi:mannose-6-phosphate isomerase-like protein (cupin superfamily)